MGIGAPGWRWRTTSANSVFAHIDRLRPDVQLSPATLTELPPNRRWRSARTDDRHGEQSPRAKVGTGSHEGLTVAVEEFNRRQKVHTAKLVTIDDSSDPAKAVAAVDELLSKGVVAFVAGFGSNIVAPASIHGFEPGLQDFKPLISVVKVTDRPDAVLISAYEAENVAFMRAAQVVRPDVKLVGGTNGWSGADLIRGHSELMRHTVGGGFLPCPVEFGTEAGKRFSKAFSERFGRAPDFAMQLWGYDTGMLMREAIERAAAAGHVDAASIAKMLRNDGKPQRLLSGTVTFDPKGFNTTFEYHMVQHVPGGLVMVWPPEVANGKLVLPARSW